MTQNRVLNYNFTIIIICVTNLNQLKIKTSSAAEIKSRYTANGASMANRSETIVVKSYGVSKPNLPIDLNKIITKNVTKLKKKLFIRIDRSFF